MAEVKQWITVNGVHIPIMEGESKMAAVKKFIKGKRKDRIAKEKGRRENEHFDYFADETHRVSKELDHVYKKGELDDDTKYNYSHEIAHDRAEDYMRKKYGENWKEGKQTIKGRAKTASEVKNDYNDKYMDKVFHKFFDKRIEHMGTFDRELAVKDAKLAASETKASTNKYIREKYSDNKQVKIGGGDARKAKISSASYKMSGRNSFSPKVSRALTKLDTNKGVRIDGKAWKKVGPDKFMNENGFKIDKWQMANRISEAKDVKYYKKWED